MQFNPGTGTPSIVATTAENQFFNLAAMCQEFERSADKNPNEASIVISSLDQDEASFSGQCTIYSYHELIEGKSTFTYPDPYKQTIYSEGVGGDGNALNYSHALAERALILIRAERKTANNPNAIATKFNTVQWQLQDQALNSPAAHNCILSFSFSLPIDTVSNGGSVTITAREYLIGAVES
ncbi:MAG: hypothetical protein ACRC8A_12620 [Microcoleaceae cyanobacterium]